MLFTRGQWLTDKPRIKKNEDVQKESDWTALNTKAELMRNLIISFQLLRNFNFQVGEYDLTLPMLFNDNELLHGWSTYLLLNRMNLRFQNKSMSCC